MPDNAHVSGPGPSTSDATDTTDTSDTTDLTETADTADTPGTADTATRQPNRAASAASRARRIGGARSTANGGAANSGAANSGAANGGAAAKGVGVTDDDREPATAGPAEAGSPRAALSFRKRDKAAGTSDAAPTPAGSVKDGATKDGATKDGATKPGATKAATPAGEPVVITQVPGWVRWLPALVLATAAVVVAVLLAVSAHGVLYAKPSSSTQRDRVLAAAKTCVAAANTYSYTSIAADEAKGLACSTGQWAAQYRKAIEQVVKPTATKLKASQSVQINNAGIQTITDSGRQWTVVVYGQTTIRQASTKPRVDPFSAVVTMDDVSGKWLISNIGLVVKPGS